MVGRLIGTMGFYTNVKPIRSHADRIAMVLLAAVDGTMVLLALLGALIGSTAIWSIFAAGIEHETRLHDTRVRVAELQIRYIERARASRGEEVIEVGEATEEDGEAVAA